MEKVMKVEYKWHKDKCDDLICDLTKFIDSHLLHRIRCKFNYTYLCNDLIPSSKGNVLYIAFRYPGATRGSLILKRLSINRFEIIGIRFNTDVCFDEFGVYDESLKTDINDYIGTILDFADVELINNYNEETYY